MFDNHRNPEADYYDHEKGSFVTVYAVNEKEKTVSLLKKLPVVKANVTSNTIYNADSGHIFGMCGTVKSGTAKTGMTYEFDYESGEILNQYYINKNYYRAIELKANYVRSDAATGGLYQRNASPAGRNHCQNQRADAAADRRTEF